VLDIPDPSSLPENFESVPWKDAEDRLYWFYPDPESSTPPFNRAPSRYNAGSFFKILDRRPVGFIAVWWDKRDDELPELNHGGWDIKLTNAGTAIHTNQFRRVRKPSPPVVQVAKVAVKLGANNTIEEFSLRFFTRTASKGYASSDALEMPAEPDDDKMRSFAIEDADIEHYVTKHRPDYLDEKGSVEAWLADYSFLPDTTLFRVKITVVDPSSGAILPLFDGKVPSDFKRRSRYEYLHTWERGRNEPPINEALIRQYCSEDGAFRFGTSVWFEDLTGHVATAEKTIFKSS
jgi:hypothetical protein